MSSDAPRSDVKRRAVPPAVQFSGLGFTMHLPDAMQAALDAAAPGFRTIRPDKFRADVSQAGMMGGKGIQPLFAVVSDFDGDGSQDAVVEGSEPADSALHVVAIMNGTKPRAFEVTSINPYDADAVGTYLSLAENANAAFDVIRYPDQSTRYTYAGGRFTGAAIGN
ncbi:MAG TPA: hypothetical protein VG916_01725 [Gemmatimonadaceae bacterium]|nr:hypothetical protein [Gemmatimonadaceae bacterium]